MPDATAAPAAPATGNPATAAPATPAAAAPVAPPVTPTASEPAAAAGAAPAVAAPTGAVAEPAATGTDWATLRTKYANGDEKLEKRLARYSSEKEVIDAMLAAQNKIASGNLKEALPENATPEQKAEWRKQNGIPESADKYAFKTPEGLELDDYDKAALADFAKAAHEGDMTPAQVQKAVDWHFAQQERELTTMRENDAAYRKTSEDALRQEWGSEYRLNVNLITGLLDGAPQGVKDQVLGARLADGTELSAHPDTLRWLASSARQTNPVATVVPGAGTNSMQVIESELASITKLMGDKKSAYWKGPESAKMQQRYRDLVNVQQKLK